MNGGLESSNDYLQLWHAYLDFLKRLYVKNKESKPNQAELIEELREYFQKAINQQFDCKLILIIPIYVYICCNYS
jgi:hypothetical protein